MIYIKTKSAISEYDNVDKKNPTQLATNFFCAVFEKTDDSYKEYVLPDSQKRIAELVEIFRSKYQDCTIQVAETESISSLIIRELKGKNVPMPLYFYVNNGDYGFGEQIIFVIDETGKLKIKQMTLKQKHITQFSKPTADQAACGTTNCYVDACIGARLVNNKDQ